jgi:hypothetical protein
MLRLPVNQIKRQLKPYAQLPSISRSIIRYLRMMHGGAKDSPNGRT